MIVNYVLAAVSLLFWGLLAIFGSRLVNGLEQSHRPSLGQIEYYQALPGTMLLIVLILMIWLACARPARSRRAVEGVRLVLVLSLTALLPYLFVYTGGM